MNKKEEKAINMTLNRDIKENKTIDILEDFNKAKKPIFKPESIKKK